VTNHSTQKTSCTPKNSRPSPIKRLTATASCTNLTSLLANTAASSLVIASAGFGAVYAWTTGGEHGVIFGALFVLMAVSLEIAKPLAVATSLTSFRSWSPVRGGTLLLLAAVAMAYSLTSELTLMSGARGDMVAERQAKLKAGGDASDQARHARDRYEAAQTELASLPTARPASELQKQISELMLTPGADGCAEVNGKITRTVCPLVTDLKAEKARAERRASLEVVVAQPLSVLTKPTETLVKDADPGAAALSAYAAALGFKLPAETITEWLALVPVLALEISSALAGVLAMSLRAEVSGRPATEEAKVPKPAKLSARVETPARPAKPVSASSVKKRRKRTRKGAGGGQGGSGSGGHRMPANVIDLLKAQGGRIEGGQRGIGKLLGVGKSRAHDILHELAAAGAVILATSKSGTSVRLAAA
jgi:hypothetical protein